MDKLMPKKTVSACVALIVWFGFGLIALGLIAPLLP